MPPLMPGMEGTKEGTPYSSRLGDLDLMVPRFDNGSVGLIS